MRRLIRKIRNEGISRIDLPIAFVILKKRTKIKTKKNRVHFLLLFSVQLKCISNILTIIFYPSFFPYKIFIIDYTTKLCLHCLIFILIKFCRLYSLYIDNNNLAKLIRVRASHTCSQLTCSRSNRLRKTKNSNKSIFDVSYLLIHIRSGTCSTIRIHGTRERANNSQINRFSKGISSYIDSTSNICLKINNNIVVIIIFIMFSSIQLSQ